MNVDDQRSDNVSSDEEDYEDNKKRTKDNQRRRSKAKKGPDTLFERLGEIGIDILNETIDHAERQDSSPRRRQSRNQGGTIINSFAELFSCGAPSRY